MSMPADTVPPFIEDVVHPTDLSPASERAFAHALAIALVRRARLVILHVAADDRPDWGEFPAVRSNPRTLGSARARQLARGALRTTRREDYQAHESRAVLPRGPSSITSTRLRPILLVVATEGRDGAARWLHGSVAEAMARRSKTMTLFVPADAERSFVSLADGTLTLNNVLIPVDHTPDASAAVEFARRVADIGGDGKATISLLHVGAETDMPRVRAEDGPRWTFARMRREGEPVAEILAAAELVGADLIVMPTAGRAGVRGAARQHDRAGFASGSLPAARRAGFERDVSLARAHPLPCAFLRTNLTVGRVAMAVLACAATSRTRCVRRRASLFRPGFDEHLADLRGQGFRDLAEAGIVSAGPVRCVVQRCRPVTAGGIRVGASGQQRTDDLRPVLVGSDHQCGVAAVVAPIGVRSGFDQGDGDARLRPRERESRGLRRTARFSVLDPVQWRPTCCSGSRRSGSIVDRSRFVAIPNGSIQFGVAERKQSARARPSNSTPTTITGRLLASPRADRHCARPRLPTRKISSALKTMIMASGRRALPA